MTDHFEWNLRRADAARRWRAISAALMLVGLSSAALGQGITGLTASKNAGDFTNGASSSNLRYSEQKSAATVDASSPDGFTVRYAYVVANDNDNINLQLTYPFISSTYGMAFTVTAPGSYDLVVTTRIKQGLTIFEEGFTRGSVQRSDISGSQSGGTLTGSLGLPAVSGTVDVDDTGLATIIGTSNGAPVAHQLNFAWQQRCAAGSIDGDACGIRAGLSTTLPELAVVGEYPGVPARTAADDGHIVEVTLISYCGDGVIQADKGETCDEGAANGGVSCCNSNCTLAAAGASCRNPAGGCDVVETCDGVAATCPADVVVSSGTTCRAAAGACDADESCDGATAACPADAKRTTQCRASAGLCDAAEICDGVGDDCPADVNVPDGTDCDDGAFCNGHDACTGGVCGGAVNPCPTTLCDEAGRACFIDGCPILPRDCRAAGTSKLLVKNKHDDTKDKLVWIWGKGDATTPADFDDPTDADEYALCFYAGATPTLLQGTSVPPGGKWSFTSKGYKYSDADGENGGITKILLKGGAAGKSKALVKGKGVTLPDFDDDLPLEPDDLPMIVQLRNNRNDVCWGSIFGAPTKNTIDQFNAKTAP